MTPSALRQSGRAFVSIYKIRMISTYFHESYAFSGSFFHVSAR